MHNLNDSTYLLQDEQVASCALSEREMCRYEIEIAFVRFLQESFISRVITCESTCSHRQQEIFIILHKSTIDELHHPMKEKTSHISRILILILGL